jgi:hypothetical protein
LNDIESTRLSELLNNRPNSLQGDDILTEVASSSSVALECVEAVDLNPVERLQQRPIHFAATRARDYDIPPRATQGTALGPDARIGGH